MSLVGNRPQFVKAAPLSRALRARGTEILVHSGQHYDPELADLFFDELAIPTPDHALGVGKGTPLGQLAAMLTGLEAARGSDGTGRPLGLRRHDHDTRRSDLRGQVRRPAGPRRGRPAVLRSRDARGAEPRRDGPLGRVAVLPDPSGRRESGSRGHHRGRAHGRRRHAATRRCCSPMRPHTAPGRRRTGSPPAPTSW